MARSSSPPTSWRRRFTDAASAPLDETRAWTLLGINLAVLPGLGSILAGRRLAGIAQAIVSSAGAILSTWWLLLLLRQWSDEGYFPADGGSDLRIGVMGVVLFGIAWLWSLATSLSVLRSIRSTNRSHGDKGNNNERDTEDTEGAQRAQRRKESGQAHKRAVRRTD